MKCKHRRCITETLSDGQMIVVCKACGQRVGGSRQVLQVADFPVPTYVDVEPVNEQ